MQPVSLQLDTPIQYVKGVGPKRAALFAGVGITTVADLLHYFPFRHEVDTGEVAIEDLAPGQLATIRGEITRIGGRFPGLRADLDDGTGVCTLRWFNRNHGGQRVFEGATVVATGKIDLYNDLPQMIQPRIEVYAADTVLMAPGRGQRLVGVYRGGGELKSTLVRRTVQTILNQPAFGIEEFLPEELLARNGWPLREAALRSMHLPASESELMRARTRLAYEELFLLELAMAMRRQRRVALFVGQKLPVTPEIDARIRARFPFALTPSQDHAITQIVADLQCGRPMTRLLQGDVGSGKTVVALYACLAAIANGKQAAIMAPTEILAEQHFRNVEQYLDDSRVRSVLLRGRMSPARRTEILATVERGEMDLIVGTQALIQKDVAFGQLAVVVVDEQHKFGVLQRHQFRTKGPMPHYLVMTATPIPRTLGLTVFGDLDVSLIRQPPPGRGRIITRVTPQSKWGTVMGYVRKRLERGEQAYVVCPAIGDRRLKREAGGEAEIESEPGTPLVTVEDEHARLAGGPWKGLNIATLHGGLKTADKERLITDFRAGRLHALVSTTVVEVGVDVPNATIMVIVQAERYGLAQLHQLRGRVGRGSKESLCVLIHHSQRRGKSGERLGVLAQTTDGFAIAEADLRQRGPGELFGTRQHGLPDLQVASIVGDLGLLEQARDDAFTLIGSDPVLERPEHQRLLPALQRLFGEKLKFIDAA